MILYSRVDNMNKDIKKLLIVLALYALSGGFFYNFWELWLADNNMSISTIGTISSLGALITVSVIFLSSNLINPKKLKKFLNLLMIIKTIVLTLLFLLYQSNLNVIIKFLIIVDYSVDTEIFVCFYPLISLIQKDDKLYAARGLTYDISYYIGVLIVSLLLGRTIGNYTIDYNSYVISATILMFIAIIILLTINTDKYLKKVKSKGENEILLRLLRKIKKDKISIFYLLFNLFVNIGYFILMGLVLLVLTNVFSLEPFWASNIKLSVGIFAVLIAALILAKFTFKNNYINLSIKFLGRTIMYVMAWIFPNVWTFGIALFYTMVLSSSYTHIADAPYINRFDNDDQLAFANLKEMVTYLSRSIGTYLCGVCLVMGFKYNFILAAVFSFLTTLFAYQALYLYNKEKRGKHGRK